MSIFRKLLGPKSKYNDELPYGYEARVRYLEGDEDTNTYFADTICGLVGHLREKEIAVAEVAIYEIYSGREKELDKALFTSPEQQWLRTGQLCKSFEHYYEGHIFEGGCTFSDRENTCIGP